VDRFLIVLLVSAFCVAIALVVNHKRASKPVEARRQATVPAQIDRHDFANPGTPWLLLVFTSSTCMACAEVLAVTSSFDGPDVAVLDVEFGRERSLHERYRIDSVPTTVLADLGGAVRAHWLGRVDGTELHAALRDPDQG
jgi:thioredoxin-related protein